MLVDLQDQCIITSLSKAFELDEASNGDTIAELNKDVFLIYVFKAVGWKFNLVNAITDPMKLNTMENKIVFIVTTAIHR